MGLEVVVGKEQYGPRGFVFGEGTGDCGTETILEQIGGELVRK